MALELAEAGITLPGVKDTDQELWDFWVNRRSARSKGDRVMLNRYQACVDRLLKSMPFWSMDTFERQYVALELGMIKSTKFLDRLMVKSTDVPGESGGSTSSKALHIEDKTLRQCVDNAVLISVGMLSNYDHRRLCVVIGGATSHVKDFRVEMCKSCRSAPSTLAYLIKLNDSIAAEHIYGGFRKLDKPAHLQQMGYFIPPPKFRETDLDMGVVQLDEEFAAIEFQLHGSMCGARMSRLLHFFHASAFFLPHPRPREHAARGLSTMGVGCETLPKARRRYRSVGSVQVVLSKAPDATECLQAGDGRI